MDEQEQSQTQERIPTDKTTQPSVPIVAIGASAGGLGPLQTFFSRCPCDLGVAYVVIQHLPPDSDSALTDILDRSTDMPVVEISDSMVVEPDQVYVLPPNFSLELEDTVFRTQSLKGEHRRLIIDGFFTSLARSRREQSYAVVLSGTGADGSEGAKAIREAGGLVIAQDPEEAEFDGMPAAAIRTGATDAVVAAGEIPGCLQDFIAGQSRFLSRHGDLAPDQVPEAVKKIIALVSRDSPNDFGRYKDKTLMRRISRRMGLSNVEDEQAYLRYLEHSEEERNRLYRDLLISVTSFSRDPDNLQALDEKVLQPLVANSGPDQAIRLWVAGCATGEEAYTLAIMLHENMRREGKRPRIQIFATDIDEEALRTARQGLYPDSIESGLSQELLHRYFRQEGRSYRVIRELREEIVFAYQNLITDTPFSRLDLITCRNLMIYLKQDIQSQLMEIFHFALDERGVLFLGSSESIGRKNNLFEAIDRPHRIYRRKPSGRQDFKLPFTVDKRLNHSLGRKPESPSGSTRTGREPARARLGEQVKRHLLDQYTPPAVLANKEGEALYFVGETADYLKHPYGEPSYRLFDLAREPVRSKLRGLFRQSVKESKRVESAPFNVIVRGQGRRSIVAVTPLPLNETTHYLVTFEKYHDRPEWRHGQSEAHPPGQEGDPAQVKYLEEELDVTRAELQSTIDELEASNQDLKVSHEEAVSMNEELQSTNEELETSKEELQSLNEEMYTVNTELRTKIEQLDQAYSDLDNLLRSITSATLFIDPELRIRLFTPNCQQLFNLVDTDIGRPLDDIKFKVDDRFLLQDSETSLNSLESLESEVHTEDGNWYLRRASPYRTGEDRIAGVVITYTDITRLKSAQDELSEMTRNLEQRVEESTREARDHLRERELATRERDVFFELSAVPFFVIAEDGYFQRLNPAWNRLLGWALDELYERPYLDLIHPQDLDGFKEDIKKVQIERETVNVNARFRARDGSYHWLEWEVQPGEGRTMLGVVRDISERVHSAHAVQRAQAELEKQVHQRTEQLQAEKDLAQVTLMSIGEALITTDTQGLVTSINPVAERLTGHSSREAIGRAIDDVLELRHDENGDSIDEPVTRALRENRTVALSEPAKLVRKDGKSVHVDASVSPVYNVKGDLLGAVAVFFDVSYARELTKRIRHRASHDDLTGLVNRGEFEKRLRTVVENARKGGKIHALLFMDLDRFKIINDKCGHLAGDELLREIAGKLQLHVRQRDTLARMGGDEFAAILENCTAEQAYRIADDMLALMHTFRFTWDDRTFQVGMSIGVTLIDQNVASVREAVHNADSACYTAKEAGRDRVYVFNQGDENDLHHQTYMYWVNKLSQALEEDRIELVAQPIVDLNIGETRGNHFEILARLRDEEGKMILPDKFINAAERYNLMPRLDRHVISKVFSWLSANAERMEDLDICSINLSVSTLADDRFPGFLNALVKRHKVPSHKICLEITETMAIRNLSKTIELAHEFKRQGFLFCLDDFGTGFASYHYLRQLPVDFLKLDGGLVSKIMDDPMDEALVRSMNEIGHIMGKKTIAESVETQEVFDRLKEIGVDYVQGFVVGKPREINHHTL